MKTRAFFASGGLTTISLSVAAFVFFPFVFSAPGWANQPSSEMYDLLRNAREHNSDFYRQSLDAAQNGSVLERLTTFSQQELSREPENSDVREGDILQKTQQGEKPLVHYPAAQSLDSQGRVPVSPVSNQDVVDPSSDPYRSPFVRSAVEMPQSKYSEAFQQDLNASKQVIEDAKNRQQEYVNQGASGLSTWGEIYRKYQTPGQDSGTADTASRFQWIQTEPEALKNHKPAFTEDAALNDPRREQSPDTSNSQRWWFQHFMQPSSEE